MNKRASEPDATGAFDVEAFSRNLARSFEQGGKALATYLKPDDGRTAAFSEQITEIVRTLGDVAHYWTSDPARMIELQTMLGKAYLDLWANAAKRMMGAPATPVVAQVP